MKPGENHGPAMFNIREGSDPLASFSGKKSKSKLPTEPRPFGAPKHMVEKPEPGKYYSDICNSFNQHRKALPFQKQAKKFDIQKYKSGMEEFTSKGFY